MKWHTLTLAFHIWLFVAGLIFGTEPPKPNRFLPALKVLESVKPNGDVTTAELQTLKAIKATCDALTLPSPPVRDIWGNLTTEHSAFVVTEQNPPRMCQCIDPMNFDRKGCCSDCKCAENDCVFAPAKSVEKPTVKQPPAKPKQEPTDDGVRFRRFRRR